MVLGWGSGVLGERVRRVALLTFVVSLLGRSVRPVTSSERNCKLPAEGYEEVFEQKETKETKEDWDWGVGFGLGFWSVGGRVRRDALPTFAFNRHSFLSLKMFS